MEPPAPRTAPIPGSARMDGCPGQATWLTAGLQNARAASWAPPSLGDAYSQLETSLSALPPSHVLPAGGDSELRPHLLCLDTSDARALPGRAQTNTFAPRLSSGQGGPYCAPEVSKDASLPPSRSKDRAR